MDKEWGFGTEPGRWYTLRERLTFSAVVVLFAVIIFMVSLRLYLRWYLLRQLERRGALTGIELYEENNQAGPTADRGLDAAVLESLPVFLYSSKEEQLRRECAVCLSEFEENDPVRLLPKCDHSFHVDCIDMWLYSHSTCPICRSKVEPAANQPKPILNVEPGSSSRSEPRQDERNLDVTVIVTTMSVRTEVPPPSGVELESEVAHSSPPCLGSSASHGTRLSSFNRLLSTGRKPPIDGSETMAHGQGTSHGSTELDLEGEPSEGSEFTQRNQ